MLNVLERVIKTLKKSIIWFDIKSILPTKTPYFYMEFFLCLNLKKILNKIQHSFQSHPPRPFYEQNSFLKLILL